MAEHFTRNEKVVGSTHTISSSVVADFISFATTFLCHRSFIPSLLLSKSNPLRRASIWFAPCGRRLGCAENRVGLPPNRRGGRNKRNLFSCTAKKPVISRITGFSSCSEISLRTSGSTQRFYPEKCKSCRINGPQL